MSSPRVVFILGASRSGTSITADIVGEHDGVVNLGEVHWLGRYGIDGPNICGCGEPILKCDFWRDVLARVFGSAEPFQQIDEYRTLQSRVARTRHLPRWLSGRIGPEERRYAEIRTAVTVAAAEVAGVDTVVDASKFPVDLMALRIGGLEVTPLHVTRDVRGVVCSWATAKARTGKSAGQSMATRSMPLAVADWALLNITAEMSSRGLSIHRAQYEDITRSPDQIGPLLGLDGAFDRDRPLDQQHSFEGNPDRSDRRVRPVDERWRADLPPAKSLGAALLAWPLQRRYGYTLRPGSADPDERTTR